MAIRFGISAVLVLLTGPALAAPPANTPTPAEAKAMLDKAVAYYKDHGRADALKAFNTRKAPFSDRTLYVFCIGPDKKLAADGEYREYIGQSADLIKDASGRMLGQAMLDAAAGPGEIHYSWFNPATKLIEPKMAYLTKVETDVCGVGVYDPN
ncbi:MAG: cache domain-containing protein [Alphaproteobacteria bacterium]|nr:cache domain-containing protein [Alphaproteobacteria bacterium]